MYGRPEIQIQVTKSYTMLQTVHRRFIMYANSCCIVLVLYRENRPHLLVTHFAYYDEYNGTFGSVSF